MLVSTMRTPDNNTILLLNGKPEIKANSFRQMTISPDGKQIAMIITPQPNAPSFLTVNGKQVAGTEGLPSRESLFQPGRQPLRGALRHQDRRAVHDH